MSHSSDDRPEDEKYLTEAIFDEFAEITRLDLEDSAIEELAEKYGSRTYQIYDILDVLAGDEEFNVEDVSDPSSYSSYNLEEFSEEDVKKAKEKFDYPKK